MSGRPQTSTHPTPHILRAYHLFQALAHLSAHLTRMQRRAFLQSAAAAALSAAAPAPLRAAASLHSHSLWTQTWQAALKTLAGNIRRLPQFPHPVLIEGSTYLGVWHECGPHESLAYAQLAAFIPPADGQPAPIDVALNAHRVFFALQRPDGQIPAAVKFSGFSWGQLQMVTPLAATAWQLAQLSGNESFLAQAYEACSRWDAWLRRYRNTRGTGLVEAFCTYDTGQDHSPRWDGVPNACPHFDARICPPAPSVPRLCPDLSASVFGARVALSAMASALGRTAEAQRWTDDAEHIRQLILSRLWSPEDASFYDLAPDNTFVRIRTVANLRILAEHLLRLSVPRERDLFHALLTRQLRNPRAYWPRYPFPSVALDDTHFVRPIPRNSWGGASQALTALRTLRWMDHYNLHHQQRHLMQSWCHAILRAQAFRQQLDPDSGVFTLPDPGGYSPAALVFLHFAHRLGHAPNL